MQSRETGELIPITEEKTKALPPDVPQFHIGQIVEVNGGRFRVRKITRKDLILRGVPSEGPIG